MIIKSGVSVMGESHKRSGDGVCQDSHFYEEKDGMVIAAVADGLGSSSHSDMASQEAAKSVVRFCMDKISSNKNANNILEIMREAFDEAKFNVERKAREKGYELDECDTTLCLAVFCGGNLFWGQAGDSGMIAFRSDGFFEKVVNPEDGANNEGLVYPLCSEDKWKFGKYSPLTRSVLLVTDGVWNILAPPLLKDQSCKLDNATLNFFMNHPALESLKQEQLDGLLNKIITDIEPQRVNYDDKTLVLLVDTEVLASKQPSGYYTWPSSEEWEALRRTQLEKLYPDVAISKPSAKEEVSLPDHSNVEMSNEKPLSPSSPLSSSQIVETSGIHAPDRMRRGVKKKIRSLKKHVPWSHNKNEL